METFWHRGNVKKGAPGLSKNINPGKKIKHVLFATVQGEPR